MIKFLKEDKNEKIILKSSKNQYYEVKNNRIIIENKISEIYLKFILNNSKDLCIL